MIGKGKRKELRILLGIVIVIVSLIVLSQGIRSAFSFNLNAQKGSKEEVLRGKKNAPINAFIVYQPGMTGFTDKVVHQIAAGLNDSGYEVTMNHPGEYLSTNVSQYALVVFCSPVYSGQPSKAITNYISSINIPSSCRIALISTGSFKYYMELDAMEKFLQRTKVYKKVKFIMSEHDNDITAYNLGLELSK